MKTIKIQKDQILYSQGDEVSSVFVVKKGKIRLYILAEDGRDVSLDIVGENEVFGVLGKISDEFAQAFEDSELIGIQQSEFDTLSKKTLLWILREISKRNEICKMRMKQILLMPLEQRLFHTADYLASKVGRRENGRVTIDLSQEEFASFCGASRECVSKVLSKMKDIGIVKTNRRKIVLYITKMDRFYDYSNLKEVK
ncbi:MAG: Crp/Fnr family transcriptional regulator [Candidatus Calescibacterium sp.]|nr:Crp/Fnr family transcriptional regulator [Candidatus Calescibacterium sp.]MCX7733819.1 Crp/Fnr family transcriptional regulator [bacterium]MDW8086975.1 Crp/Fnr family transcriptional regulator [Candidatus Calescibacterium sp.]